MRGVTGVALWKSFPGHTGGGGGLEGRPKGGCEQRHRCLRGQAFNNDYKLELAARATGCSCGPGVLWCPPRLFPGPRPRSHEETLELCGCLWERMSRDARVTEDRGGPGLVLEGDLGGGGERSLIKVLHLGWWAAVEEAHPRHQKWAALTITQSATQTWSHNQFGYQNGAMEPGQIPMLNWFHLETERF